MSDNIVLKKMSSSAWVYNSVAKTYSLTIDSVVVAIIDEDGNLKIKGRVLKI